MTKLEKAYNNIKKVPKEIKEKKKASNVQKKAK